jgi:5-methyltetrahydropteroyltriglutamate--homocysteine methyltransferase
MIKTTHVGSLPRPAEMITRQLKKETIPAEDVRSYVADLMKRQLSLGLHFINNGELPRSDYINATVQRIAGFNGTCIAPIPQDLEELPDYARRFGGRNGLITLNPKAPIKLPSCSSELSYIGEDSLRHELEMMVDAYQSVKGDSADSETGLFFTAPSPGTVALFLENNYYSNYEEYIQHLSAILQKEYEIINSYGVAVQIDCPDLAMGRHTRYKHLDDGQFLSLIDININYLNRALEKIDAEKCRAHICWGNYPGTHHCDVGLKTIFNHIMRLSPKYISLESCNHRHAHEWQLFNEFKLPDDKVLLPGVVDTTSNTVEHPELVAERLINFARILGTERVVGSTDCGFASTASAASVSGEVAWLKLQSLVDGAKIANNKLSSQ